MMHLGIAFCVGVEGREFIEGHIPVSDIEDAQKWTTFPFFSYLADLSQSLSSSF